HQQAAYQYQQALQIAIATGIPYPQVEALLGLAAADQADQPEAAVAHADQALDLSRRTGFRMLEGQALTRLAAIHLTINQPDQAAHTASAALAIHRQTGHHPGETDTRQLLRHINQQPT